MARAMMEDKGIYGVILDVFRERYGEKFSFDKCVVDSKSETVTFWTYEAWEQRNKELAEGKGGRL